MAVNAPDFYELWQFDIWIFMNYGSLKDFYAYICR